MNDSDQGWYRAMELRDELRKERTKTNEWQAALRHKARLLFAEARGVDPTDIAMPADERGEDLMLRALIEARESLRKYRTPSDRVF